MSKLIIDNRSKVSDAQACELVAQVISKGRISNEGKQYCYLSITKVDGEKIAIATDVNKSSDKFVIYDDVLIND